MRQLQHAMGNAPLSVALHFVLTTRNAYMIRATDYFPLRQYWLRLADGQVACQNQGMCSK